VLAKGEGVEPDPAEAYYWALRSNASGPSASLNYEVDRANLIAALEQGLPADVQAEMQARAALSP